MEQLKQGCMLVEEQSVSWGQTFHPYYINFHAL
jgi:hypothetical protein